MTANHYAVLIKARHSSKGFFFLIGGKLLYNITLVSAVHFNEAFWHSLVKISWLVALIHFFCSGEVIELVWQQTSLSSQSFYCLNLFFVFYNKHYIKSVVA